MISAEFNAPAAFKQAPTSGYGFLESILDSLDDGPILAVLSEYRRTGRAGYPIPAMWRAWLSKYILGVRYNLELLDRLRGSKTFRQICGFLDAVPSESALSRFTTRLMNHQPLVKECLTGATSGLRDLLPGDKDQDREPLGGTVAIDSTLFPSYSNPNRRNLSDLDARWGLKHSSKSKEGKQEWGWGYKMHLLSDANYGIPLDFIITPANESDSPQLPLVVGKAKRTHAWLQPEYLLADRGYDAQSNHQFLVDQGITPVIHIRTPGKGKLHHGMYTTEGSPVCMCNVAMEYVRTDPESGRHLFRCAGGGCQLKMNREKSPVHFNAEVWEDPVNDLRVIGVLPRVSEKWKALYRLRMSIERVFRSLKHSRGLENHCARGMGKILLHATMCLLTFQATALARVKAGDIVNMRRMRVKTT